MTKKVLLTSFQTWLKHQKSNSSDDLLYLINSERISSDELDAIFFLRQLPVDINSAASYVINAVEVLKPNAIICCGMAESRSKLSIESNASFQEDVIYTSLDLNNLVARLNNTDISHDAGKFVCEGLYYQILKYLIEKKYCIPCIFIHVPILDYCNKKMITKDFKTIIRLLQSEDYKR